jgi:hypothetical protein
MTKCFGAAANYPLHARILVRVHVGRGTGGEHLLELVAAPVPRGEHEHVGDVVEEAVAGAVVAPVAGAYASGEEMEGPSWWITPALKIGPYPGTESASTIGSSLMRCTLIGVAPA